jgi:hypothetical protein
MKTVLKAGLAAILLLGMSGCGKKPGHLEPAESWPTDGTAYPRTYPAPEAGPEAGSEDRPADRAPDQDTGGGEAH